MILALSRCIYQNVPELDYHSGHFGPRVGVIFWPTYGNDITEITPPAWYTTQAD